VTPYYDEDGITIYHGDCLDVLPELPVADIVITSPPYNLGVSSGGGFARQGKEAGRWSGGPLADGYSGHDDAMEPAEYREWQAACLTAAWARVSGAIFYNHKPRIQSGQVQLPTEWNPGLPLRQIIVWDRGSGMNFQRTHFVPMHEWILVYARESFRLAEGGNRFGDVWRFPPETKVREHPAPFPVGLPARIIEATQPDLVIDPFVGSGTTLRAAADAGVRAIGIELSERYCEIAVQRLAQGVLAL
jgi:DNA modification methylase